ncbi:hypothetical protein [Paraflavitalea sp. CAU 1676]|uniref:hypothetical protein n=1 Tax=Paraflavitalea sp. CAU 1676 TaxID=3032598 RepID=UPI0023D998B1|nr:hypothetical protein [Paraflavitalea sp. CAU 1676]MDF2189332.1 hypothetical protein [Paraflavitalea sp. CAU 1676]
MLKDPRFLAIKMLLLNNHIKQFHEIFTGQKFPVTVMALYMKMGTRRLSNIIKDPSQLTYEEAGRMADYFDVPPSVISLIIHNQLNEKK